MKNLIKKMRGDMFPEIDDWTSSQDHLRNSSPNDLDFYQFLWFHPIAYTMLKIGTPSCFMITALVLALKNAKYGISPGLIIPVIGLIFCLIWLFREIGKLDVYLKMNLYDVLMKD